MTTEAAPTFEALIRRQFVIAGLAAGVVLAAVLLVAWAVPDGNPGAVLRMAPDGSRVVVASPAAEASRWAMWVVVAALVAVAGVFVLLVQHTVRVARFALRRPR